MNSKYLNTSKIIATSSILILLSGCASMETALTKRTVESSTKMSDTVFLDPVEPNQRTVFVQISNTSDNPRFNLTQGIKQSITQKGYKITSNPKSAHYLLQANILQAGETTKEKAGRFLSGGYGGALTGGVTGAAIGSLSNNQNAGLLGGLVGAAAGFAADSLIKDKLYSATIDVQISERSAKGVKVSETNKSSLHQGNSGYKQVVSNETTNLHKYQTRVQSVAEKMNLTAEEATPYLISGITQSVSGIFPEA